MFVRVKKVGPYQYLQIAHNRREGKRVKQSIVATLGRLDKLTASGAIDQLLRSAARFAERLMVLAEHSTDAHDAPDATVVSIGPALVFERLWRETGCQEVVRKLLATRHHHFDVERAVFMTVLHRLMVSGSDRSALQWRRDQAIVGAAELELQHLYRAMGWLGEELGESEPDAPSPRRTKDLIEEALFARRRDLFSDLDLVFFDTTSLFFTGDGGETLGQYGKSKDRRSDCKQMVLGMVIDGDGVPVCSEMWPGNTTDVTTLDRVAERLQRRFGVRRVCLVADAGMISKKMIAAVEARGWLYILGARLRRTKEVRDVVLNRLQVQNLFRLRFLDDATNVVLVGGVGLGKSHLVTALGLQACERGYSVLFTSAIDAINTLAAAKAAGQLKRDLRRYLRPRLLILDELGYLPIDKTGADLLFQIISQRYERGSIAITTNRVFKHWPEIFNHDATLTSAVLDRLLHHAETVTTGGTQSCCLALAWCSTRVQRVCTSIPSTEDADSAIQLCLVKNDAVSRNICH